MNKIPAQEMVNKLNKIENKIFQRKLREIDCPRQTNGYDCGIYTVLMIKKIVGKIKENGNIENICINPKEAGQYREYLRQCIEKAGKK